jgi:hypothetical protein
MSTTHPERTDRVVGVDVYNSRLDICLTPDGDVFAPVNDHEGIDSLLQRLEQIRPELAVLETSGRYECSAAMVIAASGIDEPFASGILAADRIPAGLRHSRKLPPQGIR